MRLVDYGTGEVCDRLTILALKVLFGKDTSHFVKEQTALLAKIRSRDLNGPWFHHLLELSAVNAALWHAEDDLRDLRNQPEGHRAQWAGFGKTWVEEVSVLALRIQTLNDRRADLIDAINKETGESAGPEKVTA